MNKYKVYVNEEILQDNLTLLQATRLVDKLKKLFPTTTIEIAKMK